MSAEEEQRLADLLKHAVPQPPRELTNEEITTVHVNLPRKSWLMPALAAAAVIIIGGGAGALAATTSGHSGPPTTPGTSRTTSASPTARPSPSATPVPAKIGYVPLVMGMPLAQAASVIQSAGYTIRVIQEARPGVPSGTAWATNPPAGTRLPTGANVTIYVTPVPPTATPTSPPTAVPPTASATAVPKTPKAVVVPSVIGDASLQATAELQAAGFSVTLQAQAAPPSQQVPPGIVWAQSLRPGAEEPRGATITLYCQPKP
jgi:serine/threonine-protein kinase